MADQEDVRRIARALPETSETDGDFIFSGVCSVAGDTRRPAMTEIQKQVQGAIDELVETGAERGIQVAVFRKGEQVVDAVAGTADPDTGRPVTPETVFYNFSIVKGAASTIAHILAERGLFGYDTPVVELWPEFGAHG